MRNLSRFFLIVVVFGLLAACAGDDAGLKDIIANNNDAISDSGSDTTSEDTTGEDSTGDDTTSSTTCLANEDCANGQICKVDRSVSPVEMTCQDAGSGADLGDACSADAECASNLCVDDQCAQPCQRPIDCSDDGSFICDPTEINGETINICVPRPPEQCSSDADCASPERCVAVKSATDLVFECRTPNAGGAEIGDTCAGDADCAQNLCLSDVCSGPCASTGDCRAGDNFACELTRVELDGGQTASGQLCAPPRACERNAECRVGEVCLNDRETGDSFCGPQNTGGGSLGDLCTDDSGCAENLCFDGRFREVCTPACTSDSDCASPGYHCATADVADGSGGSNSMQICVPKDPNACSSNDDCASGLRCAVISNAADTALETACIPANGKGVGTACSADSECASLVCLNDTCSDPCTNRNQCGADQLCRANSVSKDGLSGTFDMCETLVDERCDQDGICSDSAQMCNELRTGATNADEREAFCGLRDASAPQGLGGNCTSHDDCRSTICLTGLSDDCSVYCDNDSQCGAGQVCTSFLLNGTTQMGHCMRGCVNDDDCSSLDFHDGTQMIEHGCGINIDRRQNEVDQTCFRRDAAAPGELGDSCANAAGTGGDSSLCKSNLCLTNTVFVGNITCSSASDCDPGQVCEVPASGGAKQCGDQAFVCSALCDSDADCGGGTGLSCSPAVRVDVGNGGSETVSMCSPTGN